MATAALGVFGLMLDSAPAAAVTCGDPTGPGGIRIPCACGDRVVTSTVLDPADPMVNSTCSGRGLEIGTDMISLDCQRLTLVGSGSNHGIFLKNRLGVTVKRCQLSGFLSGIRVQNGGGNRLIDNTVSDNWADGIDIRNSNSNTLKANVLIRNRESGIDLSASDDNIVSLNTVSLNDKSGIEVGQGSNGNHILANTSRANGSQGLRIFEDSGGNRIRGNKMLGNLSNGILITERSGNNSLGKNVATRNGSDGLRIVGESPNNEISGFRSSGNAGDGIFIGTSGNRITRNACWKNRSDGFEVTPGVSENAFLWNWSFRNRDFGMNDNSVGEGTVGTANSYVENGCSNDGDGASEPLGLCG